MSAAIIFNKSYKQALEYGKTWDKDNGRKQHQNFCKKEEVTIKQISEMDRKEYMDCPDAAKKEERKKEEPKKLSKEERFAKIRALINNQTDEEKSTLLNLMEQEAKMDRNSMHIPLQYKVGEQIIETQALLDSGAGGQFISTGLVKKLGKK
ncbi:hypothetical protein Moror_15797 [Moniliophthora roreri MCA 2997]|uniref:Uncharacterized protein n=1 Tax=Moniliophthora roreri (strain MCA 2997) TaxID=1381753 RepID=V2WMM3_MONRO|nr:hypothetical protein Moror_15797 [Moniliophthora roreri MCA 2997]